MRTTRIALVGLMTVLLGGCAWMDQKHRDYHGGYGSGHGGGKGPRSAPIRCRHGECVVPVEVDNCAYATPDEVRLHGHPDKIVTIRWRMRGNSRFDTRKGIDFRGNGKFTLVSGDEREFVYTFDNVDKGGEHKYDVNAQGCKEHDPYIMN